MKIAVKSIAVSLLLTASLLTSCSLFATLPDNSGEVPVKPETESGEPSAVEDGESEEKKESNGETGGLQLKNPLKSKDDLNFTEEAGFAVNYLPTDENLRVTAIYYIDATGIAEIRMSSADEAVFTYRISAKTGEDISGVYRQGDSEETRTVCGIERVKLSKQDTNSLARWEYDGFSYSLYAECCADDEFRYTLERLMLYTMADTEERKLLGILNTNFDGSRGTVPEADKEYDFGGYGDGEDHGVIPYEFESVIAVEKGSYVNICSFEFKEDGTEYLTQIDALSTYKDFFCVRIGDIIPETMPYYAVEIYNGNYVGTAYISYDGRGERPTFPIYADESRTANAPLLFD